MNGSQLNVPKHWWGKILGGALGLPAGAFALVTKVHHAALDGVSAVEVMKTFCDPSAEGAQGELESPAASDPGVLGLFGQSLHSARERSRGVARLAGTSLRMLARPLQAPGRREPQRQETRPVPVTRFNARPSSSRTFGGCDLSLTDVQAIRSALLAGERGTDLAARFGINPSTISKIKAGRRWPPGPSRDTALRALAAWDEAATE